MLSSPSPSPSSASKSRDPKPGPRTESKWKAPTQLNLYNRRLFDALRSPNPQPSTPRAIKEAADSALALTARGQTRWSRAILANRRCKVRLSKVRRKKPRKPAARKPAGSSGEVAAEEGEGGKVKERLRRLGRLVPGCRRLPATSLLEEAADYVAALEVQVKAMRALAEAMAAARIDRSGPPAQVSD